MKVIEVGKEYEEKETQYPIDVTCEYCGSRMLLEKSDVYIGPFGAVWYRCPICKRQCMADEATGITLTVDNIEFPKHFWHFGNGKDLSPEDIKQYIKDGVEYFRNNPDNFAFIAGTGNTYIIVENYSGDKEYHIVVAKDYYDMEIPYEDIDYNIQDQNNWEWKNVGVNIQRQNWSKKNDQN